MSDRSNLPIPRLSVWLTHVGMVAEQVLRAFWPAFSIVLVLLAALMLGLQDIVSVEIVWAVGALSLGLFLTAAVLGLRVLKLPSRTDVLVRLDETLPGRPIQALMDDQAIGAADRDSLDVLQGVCHRCRDELLPNAPVEDATDAGHVGVDRLAGRRLASGHAGEDELPDLA